MNTKLRIYLTGVGGQGTLTATTLLARIALAQGLHVVSGEIHGMAQRGGVVESTILLGGWQSPKIQPGEADILLGFEALETLRGLPYLTPEGAVFSSSDFTSPPGVSAGKENLPTIASVQLAVVKHTAKNMFLPLKQLGRQAGSEQSGNTALLTALCHSGLLPFGVDALQKGIESFLPSKLVTVNLKAVDICLKHLAQ